MMPLDTTPTVRGIMGYIRLTIDTGAGGASWSTNNAGRLIPMAVESAALVRVSCNFLSA